MRTAYRQHMDKLAHRLIMMCDSVEEVLRLSNEVLFNSSATTAETVFSRVEDLEKLHLAAEADALELLAREAPVARDLRQVVSGIYIVEDITRMGVLALHIASTAQRRLPEKALPEPLEEDFRTMATLCEKIAHHARQVLEDYDVEEAISIHEEDDSVDEIHQKMLQELTSHSWKGAPTVDATLINRYYERFADHAVQVAERIIFLATGYRREDYLNRREQ